MDKAFLKEGLKALLPITVVFVLLFQFTPQMGDYQFHLCNSPRHNQACGSQAWNSNATINSAANSYPPAVAYSMDLAQLVLQDRRLSLFLLQLTASTILPYLFILYIMGRQKPDWRFKAGFVYLYGSGVPFILMQEWFVPQAIIQVLMLASVAEPQVMVFFLMVGWKIHREWVAAFLLTAAFILFQRYKHKLPKGWGLE